MNPVQSHGSLAGSFGEFHGNDLVETSCTEDTIAEDLSDTSQNTLDGSVSNRGPSIMQHLAPLMIPSIQADVNSQKLSSYAQDRVGSLGRCDSEGEHRKKDYHKKRSKNWTALETLKLIQVRSELDEKFRCSSRKGVLWDEVAQALHKADMARDGQQCKDKWEKLMAGYKEVCDGNRDKGDLPFYEEIHRLLSGKHDNDNVGHHYVEDDGFEVMRTGDKGQFSNGHCTGVPYGGQDVGKLSEAASQGETLLGKRRRVAEYVPLADVSVIQEILETVLSTQERLFRDVLDVVEKKERIREQIRQEREDVWRAEERAQRYAFNNTMVILTQKLLGETPAAGGIGAMMPSPRLTTTTQQPTNQPLNELGSSKKRSKNWKKTEVMHLIRCRREMESKFAQSTRRAGLWDELGMKLSALGIKRDGKQCREKWDKLMAGYKDVIDGRREKEESPYFDELSIYLDTIKEKDSVPRKISQDECIEA